MLIIGFIIIIFLLITFVLLGVLRIYTSIQWTYTEEKQQVIIIMRILGFTIFKKDLSQVGNGAPSLTKDIKLSDLKHLRHFVIDNVRLELLRTKTVVGTGEPDMTAILYGLLQSAVSVISARLQDKGVIDCQLSANFEEAVIQSRGQCMISWKLRKTMRVWKNWKTKGE
ncbi:hypothetical protein SAMN04487944_11721 [Gracilibacillus ureilyticus]|uniref:DUF2953 domain-containing protein n=1 Tax=Gracilibacillus ureilyticus TaxID=531814 RepID=A0A1H9UDS7_9BACI|nr:DUF2953 domain-containing protein [Gracilibacillus ureilyticus]SES07223.1 hypothetical protein SAMN04487944_11721 [Gracilibacillus ureilyticus]